MVGFPYTFRDAHWTSVWLDIWPEVQAAARPRRPPTARRTSPGRFFSHLGPRGTQLWRDVWDGQAICIVTGEGSRFHLEPALFDSAKSIELRLLHRRRTRTRTCPG